MRIRALEPTHGLDRLRARRSLYDVRPLCAGLNRMGQALGITRVLDDPPLDTPPLKVLTAAAERTPAEVVAEPRIGISHVVEQHWRFGLAG